MESSYVLAEAIEQFMFERGEYDYKTDRIRWLDGISNDCGNERLLATENILQSLQTEDGKQAIIDYLKGEMQVMEIEDEDYQVADALVQYFTYKDKRKYEEILNNAHYSLDSVIDTIRNMGANEHITLDEFMGDIVLVITKDTDYDKNKNIITMDMDGKDMMNLVTVDFKLYSDSIKSIASTRDIHVDDLEDVLNDIRNGEVKYFVDEKRPLKRIIADFKSDKALLEEYEKYKNEWIKEHISDDIMQETVISYKEYREDCGDYIEDMNFDTFVQENGYANGEIYDSYFEFLNKKYERETAITNTNFYCKEDLSQYKDPLLFPSNSGEAIAEATFKDDKNNSVNLKLVVSGDIFIKYKGVEYSSPNEYTDELVALIKSGAVNDLIAKGKHEDEALSLNIIDSNWFDISYSVYDAEKNEVAFRSEVFEPDLSKMTPDELKAELTSCAERLFNSYKKDLTKSKQPIQKKQESIERE